MIRTHILTLLTLISIAIFGCNQKQVSKPESTETSVQEIHGRVETVLTKEQQESMTPNSVIEVLKEGNQRFVSNDLTARDHNAQVRKSTFAQFPKAIILSCVDSRVPVEDVFDRGIGDLFVARVAGNIVNEDILGSMEYACKVSGSKLVVVLGHEHCGAVKSAIDHVELGNITPMLDKIMPAVDEVETSGERNSKNKEYVHKVCEFNVNHSIDQIRLKSPILKEMEDNGEIKIIGALYDMDNGRVSFFE